MPGKIPTQYEDQQDGPFRFTNADLKSRKPAMAGLYNAADQAASEAENYKVLNSGGKGSADDQAIADAMGALTDTQGTADMLKRAGKAGEDTVQHEPSLADRVLSPIPDAARAAATVGSFMAPEIAIPADMYLGMDAGTRIVKEGMQGVREHPIRTGVDALAMLSGVKRLSNFNKVTPGLSQFDPFSGGLGSKEVPNMGSNGINQVTDPEAYWQGVDKGLPWAEARSKAASSPESLQALEGLKTAGSTARDQIAGRAGAISMPTPEPPAISVPTDHTVFDESGRALGSQQYKGGRFADTAGDQADAGYRETRARSGNTYGMNNTPTAIPKYIDPISGEAYFDVKGGPAHGSTVSAAQLAKLGIPQPEGMVHTMEQIRALRDAAQAKFGGRQTVGAK